MEKSFSHHAVIKECIVSGIEDSSLVGNSLLTSGTRMTGVICKDFVKPGIPELKNGSEFVRITTTMAEIHLEKPSCFRNKDSFVPVAVERTEERAANIARIRRLVGCFENVGSSSVEKTEIPVVAEFDGEVAFDSLH